MSSQETIQVAAIDIGSNSIHMLVASVDPSLHSFNIKLAEKSTTRLGERNPDSGELNQESIQQSLEALQRFRDIALSHQVQNLIVVATSAVREAINGREFLSLVKDKLNLEVDLISGQEEARLIYLGVLSGMSFTDQPHILIDIGGGSTELILADRYDARALSSTRIGAVSLRRDFIKDDVLSNKRRKFLKTFIRGSLEPAVTKILDRINSYEKPVMVASSGTALSIGNLLVAEEERRPLRLHGYTIDRKRLEVLVERISVMSSSERKSLGQLNARRSEIIVPGALILETAIQMMDIEKIVLSERALREGLIVDWMSRKGFLKDRLNYQTTIRKRTVSHQAQRFSVDLDRANLVAQNALTLYDNTKEFLHTDSGIGRDLLWAAAMLHASGHHINHSSYHKHSWYLIRHGELLGYSEAEHLMVAAIARYHRKSLPKKRHEAWQLITSKEHKKVVFEMSLILRLAASFDKRSNSLVSRIDVKLIDSNSKLVIKLLPFSADQDLSLEKWSLEDCADLFYELTGVKLIVDVDQ